MDTTAPSASQPLAPIPARKDLLDLANLRDGAGHALSFFFSLQSIPDKSHHTEVTLVRNLVREQMQRFDLKNSPGLAQDFEGILAQIDEVRLAPRNWRISYACHHLGFSRSFDLPATKPIRQLHVNKHLLLAPALRALGFCKPFCVLTFERGRARLFIVQGLHIEEFHGRLPRENINLNVRTSRTASEKHLEHRAEGHVHEYFKELAGKLQLFLKEQQLQHLVFGCRDDQWGEAKSAFAEFERQGIAIGRFDLSGYEMPPTAVRESAYPVYHLHRCNTAADLIGKITDEPAHGATGVLPVMERLIEGRVEKLLLSDSVDGIVSECNDCRHIQLPSNGPCIFCGRSSLHALEAEEGLIRQALLTDTEIVSVDKEDLPQFHQGAAALLRYESP